jgi:hypothetical protein
MNRAGVVRHSLLRRRGRTKGSRYRRDGWLEWVASSAVLAVVFGLGAFVLQERREMTDTDLAVYATVVAEMGSYYDEMEHALATQGDGPASTLRAYRLPTLFWVWSSTGSYTWLGVVVVIVASAALVGVMVRPLAGAAVGGWLLLMTHELGAGVVVNRWGWVEYWTLPLVLGALLAIQKQRWILGLCLILLAALSRELAAPVLVTGAIGASVAGTRVWPWLVGVCTWVGFFVWHTAEVLPRLADRGFEKPLIDPSGISGVLSQSGAFAGAAGLLLVVYVLWTRRLTAIWFVTLPLVAGIPLAGIITDRVYWSILVLPVAVALLGFPPRDEDPEPRRSAGPGKVG